MHEQDIFQTKPNLNECHLHYIYIKLPKPRINLTFVIINSPTVMSHTQTINRNLRKNLEDEKTNHG